MKLMAKSVWEKRQREEGKVDFYSEFPLSWKLCEGNKKKKKEGEKKEKSENPRCCSFSTLSTDSLSEHFPTLSLSRRACQSPTCSKREKPTRALAQREEKAAEENREEKKKRVRRRGNEEKSNFFSLSIPKSQCIERASAPQQHYTPR